MLCLCDLRTWVSSFCPPFFHSYLFLSVCQLNLIKLMFVFCCCCCCIRLKCSKKTKKQQKATTWHMNSYLTWQPVKLQFVTPMTSITLLNWRLHATMHSTCQCYATYSIYHLNTFQFLLQSNGNFIECVCYCCCCCQVLTSIFTYMKLHEIWFSGYDHFCLWSQKRTSYTVQTPVLCWCCVHCKSVRMNTVKHQS